MTFPTVPTAAAGRVLTAVQANTTATRTFPNLSSLTKSAGDLLIAVVQVYQGSTTNAEFSSWGAGFTEILDSGSSGGVGTGIAYKFSTGSETGTFTVTQAGTPVGHAAMILLSISGAHASTPPEPSSFAGTGTNSVITTPDSDPTPSWGAADTLWIAGGAEGETSLTGSFTGAGTTPPTNFSDFAGTGISADVIGGIEAAVAFRQLNATTITTAQFPTSDISNTRRAGWNIAVRPAPAAGPPADFGPMTPYRAPGAAVQRASAW